MVPHLVLENDRFVTPLVVLVRQFVGAVIVEREGARNCWRTNDIGVDPERDAVVPAPVFARKLSGRHKIFPLPALDADIRGFFDNLSHEWTMKFIEHRVADRRILRLIRKWLK